MKRSDTLQIFLYTGIVVMSLGAGSATIEVCSDAGNCPSRLAAFIAFSIPASFFSCFPLALLVDAGLLSAFRIEKFEIFLTPVVVLCSLIATAISTSPRTLIPVLYALLAWFSFLASTAALLLAINKLESKSKVDDPDSMKTPLTKDGTETTDGAPLQPAEPAPSMPPAPTEPAEP